jgi:hypothetical protein
MKSRIICFGVTILLTLLSFLTADAAPCPTCGGAGGRWVVSSGFHTQRIWMTCPKCGGTGRVPDPTSQQQSPPSGPTAADLTAQRQSAAEPVQQSAAEREQQEAAQKADEQAAFERDKQQALSKLKGISLSDTSQLKSLSSGSDFELKGLDVKEPTDFGLKGPDDSPSVDLTLAREKEEFEKMNAAWMRNQKMLIQQRLDGRNKWCSSIYASLKTKEPPFPGKGFNELQPGDVLLISPDDAISSTIRFADRLSSWEWKSPASHTLIFLKAVNGKKLFLDNVSGAQASEAAGLGPRVITGEQFLKLYGHRDVNVAQLVNSFHVLQPLNKEEAAKLWGAARDLGIKELADERKKAGNLVDKTDFGLYGDDNMVCSEASRWALIKAGRPISETDSPFKKLIGVYYGPANFYSDEQHFLVTTLAGGYDK